MSDTTGNEVRNVETPAKEPDELETDSKQNELESQQWGSFFVPSRQPLSTALKLHTMRSNVLVELSPFETLTKTPWEKTRKCHINNW